MNPKVLALTVAVGVGALGMAERAQAQSFGLMHLPSSTVQYLGYGYGPGRHAPLVRTPGQRPDNVPRRVVHPAMCGPLGPAVYEPMRCYDGCQPCGMAPAGPMMYPPMGAAPWPVAPGYATPQPMLMSPPLAQRPWSSPWQ